MPCAEQHLGRPAQLVRAIGGEKPLDRRAAVFGAQVAARGLAAIPYDPQRVARLVVIGAQRGEPILAHQHEEADLREIGRRGAIEAAGAVLDGVEPVGRQGRTGRQLARSSCGGESPFTG